MLQDRWKCNHCLAFTTALHGQCLRCFKPRNCRPCTLYRHQADESDLHHKKGVGTNDVDKHSTGTDAKDGCSSLSHSRYVGQQCQIDSQDIPSCSKIQSTLPDFSSSTDESSSEYSAPVKKKRRKTPGLCLICNKEPNDALCVHGDTSHQFACVKCADSLKKKGRLCPICHRPIEHVVRNFIIQET